MRLVQEGVVEMLVFRPLETAMSRVNEHLHAQRVNDIVAQATGSLAGIHDLRVEPYRFP